MSNLAISTSAYQLGHSLIGLCVSTCAHLDPIAKLEDVIIRSPSRLLGCLIAPLAQPTLPVPIKS